VHFSKPASDELWEGGRKLCIEWEEVKGVGVDVGFE